MQRTCAELKQRRFWATDAGTVTGRRSFLPPKISQKSNILALTTWIYEQNVENKRQRWKRSISSRRPWLKNACA